MFNLFVVTEITTHNCSQMTTSQTNGSNQSFKARKLPEVNKDSAKGHMIGSFDYPPFPDMVYSSLIIS